jgi:hypothetical protein
VSLSVNIGRFGCDVHPPFRHLFTALRPSRKADTHGVAPGSIQLRLRARTPYLDGWPGPASALSLDSDIAFPLMRPPLLQTLTWATVLAAVLSALWLAWSDGNDGLPALGGFDGSPPVRLVSGPGPSGLTPLLPRPLPRR